MKYEQVADTTWVTPTLGYFPAIRLSPSGSGKPYKGKENPRGYLIVEVHENGEEKIYKGDIFLGQEETFTLLDEMIEAELSEKAKEKEEKIKNLPYKNILDLRPLVYEEIEKASEKFGFKTTDDLTVEVILEENMELVVRIGPA